MEYATFLERLERVRARIARACEAGGRDPAAVRLLPVTKNHPAAAAEWAARAGLPAVGENRVQEAAAKVREVQADVRWELIGHLQSNKAKAAVELFDRVQSVDSVKLLHRLDRLAGEAGRVLPVLLEVNTGGDPNKYGFDPDAVGEALAAGLEASHLQVDGLMTVAPLADDPEVARRAFDALRAVRDRLAERTGAPLPELSMGMTGDLEAAIEAGSTCVRIGTALFGERDYGQPVGR